MRIARAIAMVALLGLLAGCASFKTDAVVDADNAQTNAGVTSFDLVREAGKDGKPYIKTVRLRDGKEKDDVEVSLNMPNGLVATYKASGVRAFPGQQVRAAVEQAFVRAGVEQTEAIKEMIPKIVEALKPLWAK